MPVSNNTSPGAWKTVRVFISSTFKDMHAERDYLVRFVFPRLREELLKRRIHLVDVDLRWGVTGDQDSFEECMEEIKRCHPRFICILGGRYGWIPVPRKVPLEFMKKILNGTSSVGVLSEENTKVLEDLYILDQAMGIYRLCEKPREKEQAKIWGSKGEIAVEIFQRAELPEAMLSITASEVHFGALDRLNEPAFRYFYFREPSVTKSISVSYAGDYREPKNSLKEQMLEDLKEKIKNPNTLGKTLNEKGMEVMASLSFFEYPCKWDEETHRIIELKEFGDRVYADILSSIDAEFGTSIPEKLSEFDEENAMMESFIEERTERYVVGSRKGIFEELQKHAESTDGNGYLCLVGDPGSGKSALLAKFYRDYTDYELNPNNANHIVIPHFVGVSAGSTDIRKTLRRICHELKKSGINDKIPEDYEELRKVFPVFLKKAAEKSHVVIIIDAVNQFDTSDQVLNMLWLPTELPEGVRIILSTLPGPACDALKKRSNPKEKTLPLLNSSDENDIINEFLKRYRKNLEPEQWSAILEKEDAKTPLYLLIALEEIRTLGIYEEITARIRNFPGRVQPLFLEVLKRLENDDGFRDREGKMIGNELVRNFVSVIGVSRHGLSQPELVELIAPGDPLGNVAAIQRLLRPYLMQRGELLDFYHNQLREAVSGKYLADEEERLESHKQLAMYFYNKADPSRDKSWNGSYHRGLSELPYHQTHAKMTGELENTLTDLMFIEAKFTAGMGYDLLADYNRVSTRNKAGSPIITAKYYDGKFGVFCPFCLAWSKVEKSFLGKDMECPECKKRLVLNSFTIDTEWHPSKGERKTEEEVNVEPLMSKTFIDYFDFVFGEHHILLERPELSIQQALNQPYESEVTIKVTAFNNKGPWIRWINKPRKKSSCLLALEGHTGFVEDCSFSPDGKRIVSASYDNTIRIWDAETGEEIKVLKGHNEGVDDSVTSCSFSPDGKKIFSSSSDKTLRIWDAETGEEIKVLKGHTSVVTTCSFSPDSKKIVSASSDETLRIWDVETGVATKVLTEHNGSVTSCAFSPDGKKIVSASYDVTLRNCILHIWDVETGESINVLRGHTDRVTSCSFSPDGKKIVSASRDDTQRIWDVKTGESIKVLRHTVTVRDFSFSPDGKKIVSALEDYTLRIWDVETGESIKVLKGHTSFVTSCSYSPDGKKIVSASYDETLRIWDAETGNLIGSTSDEDNKYVWDAEIWGVIKVLEGHSDSVTSCSFSLDGKKIVSASRDNTLRIWDVDKGETIKVLIGLNNNINSRYGLTSCSFSPDGKKIVSASYDSTLCIWNVDKGESIKVLTGHTSSVTSCSFSPDGRKILSASSDNTLRIWDVETGESIKVLTGHGNGVISCSYSPDGKMIVSVSSDCSLRIWDAETGEVIKVFSDSRLGSTVDAFSLSPDSKRIVSALSGNTLRIWDVETGNTIKVLEGHTGRINSCSFSPDGKRIVSASNTLHIWDAKTGELIKVLRGHPVMVHACSFSPDCKKIVSASHDKTLQIWDVDNGKSIRALKSNDPKVTSCSFSPDSKNIVSGSHDATLRIWDSETGEEIKVLTGHDGSVKACSFSPDGKRIVSTSNDNTLRVWNAESGDEIKTLWRFPKGVKDCSFSPDGKRIVSVSSELSPQLGSSERYLSIWDAETGEFIKSLNEHSSFLNSFSFSPDGKKIVSASYDKTLRIWDVETGESINVLREHTNSVTSCSFSPDGKRIVSGSHDKTLRIWDVETGESINVLRGHTNSVISCSFSPDGKKIVSASWDHTQRIWDVETGESINILKGHTDRVTSCCFSSDGKRIVSVSDDKTLRICDAVSGSTLSIFFALGSLLCLDVAKEQRKIVASDKAGNLYILSMNELNQGLSIVTPVKYYLHDVHEWDSRLTVRCNLCGNSFSVEQAIIDLISPFNEKQRAIDGDYTISRKVLDDPRLIVLCPRCKNELKLTPFIVDNAKKHEEKKPFKKMDNGEQNNNLNISEEMAGGICRLIEATKEENLVFKDTTIGISDHHHDSVKSTPELLYKKDLNSLMLGEIKTNNEQLQTKADNIPKPKKPWWKFWK